MVALFRVVGSIVVGLALAFALVIAVEFFSSIVHPTPPDFQGTMEEMCQHVANYPDWVLALVVPFWGGTTFLSTWVARKLGNFGSGLFVGLLLLAGVVFNVAMLPYAIWFKFTILITIPVAIFLALRSKGKGEKVNLGM